MPGLAWLIVVAAWLAPAGEERPDGGLLADVPRLVAAARIPGLSIAVLADGEVAGTGAYGVRGAGGAVDAETVFPAASLGKPVFAYLVLRLADAGTIDLDAPLEDAMRDADRRILGTGDDVAKITPRHLLTHTSGLENGRKGGLLFVPGARLSFSGFGYELLQGAVEKLAGADLESLAREHVFVPLEMDRTSFVRRPALDANRARGHDRFGRVTRDLPVPLPHASFSLSTTASDYARFLAAVLRGEGLSEEMRETVFAPAARAWTRVVLAPGDDAEPVDAIAWSLGGFGLERTEAGMVAFQWGHQLGFKSYVALDPSSGDGVVWFANGDHGLALRDALVERVLPGAHPSFEWVPFERYDAPRRDLVQRLAEAAIAGGADATRALYATLRKEAEDAAPFRPDLLGEVGQELMTAGFSDPSVAILEWNASLYPDDAWSHEMLGRALVAVGRRDEGRDALQRALEIDPERRAIFELLRALDG